MKHHTTETDDDLDQETEIVKIRILNLDPIHATITVLGALRAIEPKRRTRSDAGTKRTPAATQ